MNPINSVERMLSLPGNSICADCGTQGPKWVSINIGVFLCIQCAGVHRHLGTHISQMRSIVMDVFTREEEKFIQTQGNQKINAELEHYLESIQKITHNVDPGSREKFIRAKYADLLFTNPEQAKTFVLEPKKVLPKTPSSSAMVEYSGILMINLKEAHNLVVADIITSDPYAVFQVGPQKVKSKVIQNSLNPVWNQTLQLCIPSLDSELLCSLYDEDLGGKDDFMGECKVDLKALKKQPNGVQFSIPLEKVKKGILEFNLSYIPIAH